MKECRDLNIQNQSSIRSLKQQGRKREKGDDEKWIYVVDVFHMELSVEATILDLVHQQEDKKNWPQVGFYSFPSVCNGSFLLDHIP